MLTLSDPIRFRRGLSSTSLLLAPLVGLAAAAVAPPASSNLTADLALISAHHSAFVANAVLEAAAWILFIPGVLGIVHLLRQRGVVLGHPLASPGQAPQPRRDAPSSQSTRPPLAKIR